MVGIAGITVAGFLAKLAAKRMAWGAAVSAVSPVQAALVAIVLSALVAGGAILATSIRDDGIATQAVNGERAKVSAETSVAVSKAWKESAAKALDTNNALAEQVAASAAEIQRLEQELRDVYSSPSDSTIVVQPNDPWLRVGPGVPASPGPARR